MNKRRRPAGLHEGRPALRASNACWPFLQVRGAGAKKATANSAARARKASSLFSFFFLRGSLSASASTPARTRATPRRWPRGPCQLGPLFHARHRMPPPRVSICAVDDAKRGLRARRPHRIGVRTGPAGRAQSGSRTLREGRQAAARRPSPRPPPRRRGGAAPQWQEPAALVHGASTEGARSTRAGLLAPEEAPRASPPVRPGVGPTPGQGCAGAGACCRPRPAARGTLRAALLAQHRQRACGAQGRAQPPKGATTDAMAPSGRRSSRAGSLAASASERRPKRRRPAPPPASTRAPAHTQTPSCNKASSLQHIIVQKKNFYHTIKEDR